MNSDINSRIRSALEYTPIGQHDERVRVAFMVKSELGDSGRDLWDFWRDGRGDDEANTVWKSASETGALKIGTLFHDAKINGWRDDSNYQPPSAQWIAERKRKNAESAAKEKAETDRQRAAAAKSAAALWKAGTDAVDNPYLKRKDVSPTATLKQIDAAAAAAILGYPLQSKGQPLTGQLLIAPIKQGNTLSTVELIDEAGHKAALTGRGTKTGGYWASEPLQKGNGAGLTLMIGEGVATGLTAKKAKGHPAIATFSAGNLPAVAKAMREACPAAVLIILADLVKATGEPDQHAVEAARAVGGLLAIPVFGPDRAASDTDFNDMARLFGLDAVRAALDAAKPVTDAEPQAETVEPPQSEKECTSEAIGNDCHRNTPKPDPAMLYGLTGDVAEAGAKDSEANKFAVAASFMTFLSAAVGRYVALPIGDDVHHARLFMLHVGRSSKGRKGTATALTKKIIAAIEKKHEKTSGSYAAPFCGNVHTGGLSTREGLALLIHDGIKQGKEEIPPIADKRLFVIESEFSNVLHQGKRDGNTLSGALRDGWDGLSIKPATKSAKVWATDPHIAVYANITPSELTGLMDSRELTNGFANRFLMFWAERSRIEPDPLPVPPNLVDWLADRTMAVIKFAKGDYPATQDGATAYMTDGARVLFSKIYREELTANFDGDKISAIIERRAPMLKRIALLFALTDLTRVIEEKHVIAALAWVRYHRDSVLFIFNNSVAEEATKESGDAAIKILDYLRTHGKTSRSALYKKCFSGHLSSGSLDAAIDSLLMTSPPSIEVFKSELLENGKHQKFYKCCVLGVLGVVPQPVRDCANTQPCVLGVLGAILESPSTPSTQSTQTSESLAGWASTPNTPNTQPPHRNKNLADSEKTPDILIEYSDGEVEVEI